MIPYIMGILNTGLYFSKMGIIEANIPTMEIMERRERQNVNHKISVAYKQAVLKIIDKKLTDKIRVRTGTCFPIFNPKGKKANIANTGM